MRLRHAALVAVLAACPAACKRAAPPDHELEQARRLGEDALAKLEVALVQARAGTPNAGHAECAAIAPVLAKLHASAEVMLAVKLEQICFHDLPIAELDALTDCSPAVFGAAKQALVEHARMDATAEALVARYTARCAN